MEITEEIEIKLTPEEVGDIIKKHFQTEYNIESVYFDVNGVEDPTDWRAEYPLTYKMTEVKCVGKKVE